MWKPPIANIFTAGMPEELLDEQGALKDPKDEVEIKPREDKRDRDRSEKDKSSHKSSGPPAPGKRALSDKQRDHLEEMLRSLLPDRYVVMSKQNIKIVSIVPGILSLRQWFGVLSTLIVARRLLTVYQSPCLYWRLVLADNY